MLKNAHYVKSFNQRLVLRKRLLQRYFQRPLRPSVGPDLILLIPGGLGCLSWQWNEVLTTHTEKNHPLVRNGYKGANFQRPVKPNQNASVWSREV